MRENMLLLVMIAMSSMTLFAGAVVAANAQRASSSGYMVAVLVGVLLAGLNAWIVYRTATVLARFTSSCSPSRQEWAGRTFFLAIVLWLPLAAYLGDVVSSVFVRLAM
jgi:hypothetical protein